VRLQAFDEDQLPELMGWFGDAAACRAWGGPIFRFPFTRDSFRADARLDSLPTFALTADETSLLGFGQYYLRAGRCHLARLAVSPGQRGRGFGGTLVRELCRIGSADLGVDMYSLFVLRGNEPAIRLYGRLGFTPTPCLEPVPLPADCVYMVTDSIKT
jgi:ribosomal protein S18 acetylase RimI-like enzyme